MKSWLGRRWRSISFRAGLGAALLVAVVGILGAAAYSLALTLGGGLYSAEGVFQAVTLDQVENQISAGVAPGELDVRMYNAAGVEDPTWSFWAVFDRGDIIASGGVVSPSVFDGPYERFSADPNGSGFRGTVLHQVDTRWYLVERSIEAPDGRPLRAVAAIEDLTSFREQLRIDRGITGPIVLLLIVGSALVTSFFIRRALRRVERMRAAVEAITEESLDRRVPLSNAADSIDKLGTTMNDMLERLQRATEQQSQFLADASHELRSPVAGLLAQLEVAAAYPATVDHDVLIPKLEAEAQRLQALVDDLLFVGRADAATTGPSVSGDSEMISLDDIIEAEVAHHTLLNVPTKIEVSGDPNAVVRGSRRDLERALRNLTANALRHADASVHISAHRVGAHAVLDVVDDGPGIPAGHADRIFDRFVRLDEARARDEGGAGLGLSIVRQIAEKHRGTITLIPAAQGAHFELRLPLATG